MCLKTKIGIQVLLITIVIFSNQRNQINDKTQIINDQNIKQNINNNIIISNNNTQNSNVCKNNNVNDNENIRNEMKGLTWSAMCNKIKILCLHCHETIMFLCVCCMHL